MKQGKIEKIVLNMGVKDSLLDKKNLDEAAKELALISSQKPKVTRAKKSIASFKLREGDPIGLMVTLRGKRMRNFFQKLVTIVLPRLRDFRGVSEDCFDGHGNYTLGFAENTVFPEIDVAKAGKLRGLEVTIVTTTGNDKEGKALLETLGMPFRKR